MACQVLSAASRCQGLGVRHRVLSVRPSPFGICFRQLLYQHPSPAGRTSHPGPYIDTTSIPMSAELSAKLQLRILPKTESRHQENRRSIFRGRVEPVIASPTFLLQDFPSTGSLVMHCICSIPKTTPIATALLPPTNQTCRPVQFVQNAITIPYIAKCGPLFPVRRGGGAWQPHSRTLQQPWEQTSPALSANSPSPTAHHAVHESAAW